MVMIMTTTMTTIMTTIIEYEYDHDYDHDYDYDYDYGYDCDYDDAYAYKVVRVIMAVIGVTSLICSRAAAPCAMTGTVKTGVGTMSVLKDCSGRGYTCSVIRSCTCSTKTCLYQCRALGRGMNSQHRQVLSCRSVTGSLGTAPHCLNGMGNSACVQCASNVNLVLSVYRAAQVLVSFLQCKTSYSYHSCKSKLLLL